MLKYDQSVELEALKRDPYAYFKSPKDVTENDTLKVSEKFAILDAMEHEVMELQKASEENMGGGERLSLKDVLDARRSLKDAD
ncbi:MULTISPECIES: hypothetical protein [Kordiimonas]|jgi:hypothetical protein|uniref:Uncharacterized protein n=1 Tax=Kordiimonas lacus TaxID=637679 RepID=A0A1G7AAM4_9PROT|nr:MULTISPECIES: hypothetical protein [Kordiimonas]SDE11944.1 hypothetical protein SAMN04488071_2160 [Kordiimonas lacus]